MSTYEQMNAIRSEISALEMRMNMQLREGSPKYAKAELRLDYLYDRLNDLYRDIRRDAHAGIIS